MKLAPDFVLPIDALSIKLAILATSGAGKTNTGTVIAEETLDEKGQLVVIDPQGDWWGIRSSADGKHEGYPVLVMGGPHGDVPLSPTSGKLVADLVVDERLDVVLDTSDFSNADHIRFCTDFATQLFHRKNVVNSPLLLICEEAEAVAPQQPFGEETRMLAIFQRLAKRGRRRGINILPISQRSASVNKNFLSQCRGGILMMTTGTQDRKAVDKWLQGYDTEGKRKEVIAELASLHVGEGIVWIPELRIFRKVGFRKRRTFDSSATPKQGQQRIEPKVLSPVDVERITKAIAATVQREHDNDPARLKARIKELERSAELTRGTERIVTKTVEVPVLDPGWLGRFIKGKQEAEALVATFDRLQWDFEEARKRAGTVRTHPVVERAQKSLQTRAEAIGKEPRRPHERRNGQWQPVEVEGITKAMRKILDVLAWLERIGIDPADRGQLAALAGYSPKAGGFNNYLGKLRSAGLIDYPSSGTVAITTEGDKLADPGEVPARADERQEAIYRRLPAAKAKLLMHLVDRKGQPMSREELAEEAGYSPSAGGFNNYLGSLRSLKLIDYPSKGQVAAAPVLFLEAV